MSKSANGAGNIRKRSDGRWECRFTYTDPLSGKSIRKSIYGSTQKEVRQKLTSATAEIDKSGSAFEPTKMTVRQWLNLWLSDFTADTKYLTKVSYSGIIDNHILPALGDVKLSKLTPVQVQMFYNSLQQEDKHLSPKTIHNIHGVFTEALSVAVEQELLQRNPAEHSILPKVIKQEIVPLSSDDVKHFLSAVEDDNLANYFKFVLFTGLRRSEAMGLTWGAIDEKTCTIKVYQQLQKRNQTDGGYTLAPLKNSKTRTITVSQYVMQLLKAEKLKQYEDRLQAGSLWKGWSSMNDMSSSFVFVKPDGTHYSPVVIDNHFKKVAKSIGLPDARLHDLRHTFAVMSLQNGDSVKTVQENLGHATASFTLDVYGHVSEQMKQKSAQKMQEYIDGLLSEMA